MGIPGFYTLAIHPDDGKNHCQGQKEHHFFQHVPFFHENLIRTYDNFLYTICMFLVFFTGPYIKAMAYQVFHIVCACIPSICSIVAETVTPFITLLQSQFPNVQALHRDMCFLHGGDDGFWG